MILDDEYRKCFLDDDIAKTSLYIELNNILINISSEFHRLNCSDFERKLAVDFDAIGILIKHFFVIQCIPVLRMQTESFCKIVLQNTYKEDLSENRIEDLNTRYKIEGSIFAYIMAKQRKKIKGKFGSKLDQIEKLLLFCEKFDFNKFSHSNLNNDTQLANQHYDSIESYHKTKPIPFIYMIFNILIIECGILFCLSKDRIKIIEVFITILTFHEKNKKIFYQALGRKL